jgi:hypothetical protein
MISSLLLLSIGTSVIVAQTNFNFTACDEVSVAPSNGGDPRGVPEACLTCVRRGCRYCSLETHDYTNSPTSCVTADKQCGGVNKQKLVDKDCIFDNEDRCDSFKTCGACINDPERKCVWCDRASLIGLSSGKCQFSRNFPTRGVDSCGLYLDATATCDNECGQHHLTCDSCGAIGCKHCSGGGATASRCVKRTDTCPTGTSALPCPATTAAAVVGTTAVPGPTLSNQSPITADPGSKPPVGATISDVDAPPPSSSAQSRVLQIALIIVPIFFS